MLYKSTLASMNTGDVLEVHLSDPETTDDLLIILERSGDEIVGRARHENRSSFWVKRGGSETAKWREEPGEADHV
jgi:TusA-related sulfurtransferase